MKDYTKRPRVQQLLPWWDKKINSTDFTLDHAIKLLKSGETIRFASPKDIKGLIQVLEARREQSKVASIPA